MTARRYDLRTPCRNCPFRSDATAIRFYDRQRALEIAATAFREGFPCHKSAAYREAEDEEGEVEGGYVFGPGTQTCAGSLIMLVAQGLGSIPLLLLPEAEREAIVARLDMSAPVHKTLDAFLNANERRS